MRPHVAPQFMVGDEVTDGADRGVVVLSYPRRSDGKQFPMVQILTGPRVGQHKWLTGWRALLDYDGEPLISHRCRECERSFKAPALLQARLCRQCVRRQEAREHALEQALASDDSRSAHDLRYRTVVPFRKGEA
jgi:hypothetical protein